MGIPSNLEPETLPGPLARDTMYVTPEAVADGLVTWFHGDAAGCANAVRWLRAVADDLERR